MTATAEVLSKAGLHVVAIGASAGGLEAIQEFFGNIVENRQMSFVVIQHLSSEYKSMLVELLAKNTQMNVVEAGHNMLMEEASVYVIPNDKLITIRSGRLMLEDKPAEKMPNMAIDHFLLALAEDKKHAAIAVILSGTGMDGTRGIQAVKEAGGFVLVQDPETAGFNGMPASAIASGAADLVLAPRSMPEEIFMHVRESSLQLLRFGKAEERLLRKIEELLLRHTSHDISLYKHSTLFRRIIQRMMLLNMSELADYEAYLHDHPEEMTNLYNALLIGVTRFFRDRPAFEILREKVFPAIVESHAETEPIKLWVCGCSTGEEAYSIAIWLDRFLQEKGRILEVKIFATDADQHAIEFAAKGAYPQEKVADMPAGILEEYFAAGNGQYSIHPRIRKQIVFARHNAYKDPPFIKNDLISCRNMLIYMNVPVQKKVLETFLFALKQNSFLFLGTSENISPVKQYMEELSFQWKIYKKTKGKPLSFAQAQNGPAEKAKPRNATLVQYDQGLPPEKGGNNLADDFRAALAEDFGFAGLYIDREFRIRDAVGNYKKYLTLPDHRLDLSILKMASPDLSQALHAAIHKAWQEGRKVHTRSVEARDGVQVRRISITVNPASKPGTDYTFIALGEVEQTDISPDYGLQAVMAEASQNQDVYLLQMELSDTRNKLQTTLENFESSNEELQSTNEELLSSIEELQSLNEELHTLNSEHQLKIKELIELNDDLNNYFKSSDIGQLFVDQEMRIRKFNPAAANLINVMEADIGRPVEQLHTNLRENNLSELIREVLTGGQTVEKETSFINDRSYLVRILPYVRQDKQRDGAVVTFIDITTIKYLNGILTGTFDSSLSAIMAFKVVRNQRGEIVDFVLTAANYASDALLNQHYQEAIDGSMQVNFPNLSRNGFFEQYINVVEQNEVLHTEANMHPSDPEIFHELVAVKTPYGISITFTDITEKKDSEERLHRNYNELLIVKENLKRLNADMEEKVMERTKDLSDKEERFRMVAKATNDTFWDWSLATNTIWWSENFTTVFGYEPALHTSNRMFWLNNIHQEDRERVRDSLFRAINGSSEQWSAEYRFCKADGTYAEILDRGYILKDQHQVPYRVLGSMLDVTNVKRAQAEVSSSIEQRNFLAQAMPLSVWTASSDGRIIFLNQQFARYTGMQSDELALADWQSIVHPDDVAELMNRWKKALYNRSDLHHEIRIRRKDHQYRWQLIRAKAKLDDTQQLHFWVGTNTDIHEQKMATETMEQQVKERTAALEESNRQLEESNYELQQYAYVASHDLKEPIRKINMFSNLLKTKYLRDDDEKVHDFIDRIIRSSTRMMRLIDDLLNFSNLSISDLFEETDLNRTVQDILSDLELVIQDKNAVVNVNPLPVIRAVPAQIRQVFQNLISNALKFSKPQVDPVINIMAERVAEKNISSLPDQDGPFWRISVEDNGIGFDEMYLNKIFTLFQRLHSREFEGTGIGLAVAHKIVSKHDGVISAKSRENEGSTFIIVVPAI